MIPALADSRTGLCDTLLRGSALSFCVKIIRIKRPSLSLLKSSCAVGLHFKESDLP